MICTQWIYVVEHLDRVIGFYADEHSAYSGMERHSRQQGNPDDEYEVISVPVMKDNSARHNMRVTA